MGRRWAREGRGTRRRRLENTHCDGRRERPLGIRMQTEVAVERFVFL